MLAAADGEAHAIHGDGVAVAHDQILHFDTRRAHDISLVMPRVSRNRITKAATTVAVWISAIAAVSSVPLEAKAETIDGAITRASGPIRKTDTPNSRTQAMKISSHAARMPGRNSGRVTVRIWYSQPAPQTRAHSSRLLSICSTTPASVRTPSGSITVR